ncbi:unnamed protein product [Prorocentrum cordatum]|uniref:DUF4116 domain-containing protein n=1 Tax=Prorocentrum cordatum TaxID=2364126 RepID=A0ABN9P7N7_9DINO|nr:unnamed protein product [Polarella glacialis]
MHRASGGRLGRFGQPQDALGQAQPLEGTPRLERRPPRTDEDRHRPNKPSTVCVRRPREGDAQARKSDGRSSLAGASWPYRSGRTHAFKEDTQCQRVPVRLSKRPKAPNLETSSRSPPGVAPRFEQACRGDEQLVLEAMQRDREALRFASGPLLGDRAFALRAVGLWGLALESKRRGSPEGLSRHPGLRGDMFFSPGVFFQCVGLPELRRSDLVNAGDRPRFRPPGPMPQEHKRIGDTKLSMGSIQWTTGLDKTSYPKTGSLDEFSQLEWQ